MVISSLLAMIVSVAQAPQSRDTLQVWQTVLRAGYDSTAPATVRGHPPRGLLPWLIATVYHGDSAHGEWVPVDSAWRELLVREGTIRGVCSSDCHVTRDPLRVQLRPPQFLSATEAAVVVTYINVATEPGTMGCGMVDFDEVEFQLLRVQADWRVTGQTFIGGGSGIMTSTEWDALCERTPRPESQVAQMGGVWDIRVRGSPSGLPRDSLDVLGRLTVPDSAVRERARANKYQAQGTYELNLAPLLAERVPACDSPNGRVGVFTVEGDADSIHMTLGPHLDSFDCLITFTVVALGDSLSGTWCRRADRDCPSRGSVTLRRRQDR